MSQDDWMSVPAIPRDGFALSDAQLAQLGFTKAPTRRPKPRSAPMPIGAYLRGPIPNAWWVPAARLPKPAVIVGLWIWHRRGITRRPTHIPVSTVRAAGALGISRWSVTRGLRILVDAGLITVERRAGHQLRVTLVAMRDA